MNGLPHSHDVVRALLAAALALAPLAACSKKSGGISAPSPKSSTKTGTDREFGGGTTSTYTNTETYTETYTDTGTGTQTGTTGTTGATGTTGGNGNNGILNTVTGLINGLVSGGNKPPGSTGGTTTTGGNPPGSTGGGNTNIGNVTRTQTSVSVGTQTRTATAVAVNTQTRTNTATATVTGNLAGQDARFQNAPTNAAGGAPYVKLRALIDRKLLVYAALSHREGVTNFQYSYAPKAKTRVDGDNRDGYWDGNGVSVPVTVTFDFQNRRCTAAGRASFQETQLVPRCD